MNLAETEKGPDDGQIHWWVVQVEEAGVFCLGDGGTEDMEACGKIKK